MEPPMPMSWMWRERRRRWVASPSVADEGDEVCDEVDSSGFSMSEAEEATMAGGLTVFMVGGESVNVPALCERLGLYRVWVRL
jgi:hypothetical protein